MGLFDGIKKLFGGKQQPANGTNAAQQPQENESILDKVSDMAENAWEKTKETVSDIADKAETMAEKAVENVKETASEVWDKVDDYVDPAVDKVKAVAENAWDKASDAVENVVDKIKGTEDTPAAEEKPAENTADGEAPKA